MTARRVSIITLGCEKNAVDSEVMVGLIEQRGYTLTDDPDDADVVIVNTCAFIDAAKQESVDAILGAASRKTGGKTLLVAGCMAQRYADQLLDEIPEIDGIVGTGEFPRIAELIAQAGQGERPKWIGNPAYIYDELTPRKAPDSPSAYIKIAEGCDHKCTFCVIPQMRGGFRSRPIESVVQEACNLVAAGVREINLIAQDSTQYGLDLYGRRRLPDLLWALNDVAGLQWIRLHYAYPGYFGDELIDAFRDLNKLVKYIDMPLQHSEDRILRAMQRPGRQKHIRSLLAKMRARIPEVVIRTSFIVGFPGETEEEFQNLKSFVSELEFDHVGVFTYSQEDTAPSAVFPQQVAEQTKERRASELMEAARAVAARRMGRFVGATVPVLIESVDESDESGYIGRTPYDAREIDGVVYVTGRDLRLGSIVPVRISHAFEFDLVGEVV